RQQQFGTRKRSPRPAAPAANYDRLSHTGLRTGRHRGTRRQRGWIFSDKPQQPIARPARPTDHTRHRNSKRLASAPRQPSPPLRPQPPIARPAPPTDHTRHRNSKRLASAPRQPSPPLRHNTAKLRPQRPNTPRHQRPPPKRIGRAKILPSNPAEPPSHRHPRP